MRDFLPGLFLPRSCSTSVSFSPAARTVRAAVAPARSVHCDRGSYDLSSRGLPPRRSGRSNFARNPRKRSEVFYLLVDGSISYPARSPFLPLAACSSAGRILRALSVRYVIKKSREYFSGQPLPAFLPRLPMLLLNRFADYRVRSDFHRSAYSHGIFTVLDHYSNKADKGINVTRWCARVSLTSVAHLKSSHSAKNVFSPPRERL